jgi:hypothetical protein
MDIRTPVLPCVDMTIKSYPSDFASSTMLVSGLPNSAWTNRKEIVHTSAGQQYRAAAGHPQPLNCRERGRVRLAVARQGAVVIWGQSQIAHRK